MMIAVLSTVLGCLAVIVAVAIGLRARPGPAILAPSPEAARPLPATADGTERGTNAARLAQARSWGYQLQALDITAAAVSPFDILVVDPDADDGRGNPLPAADVTLLGVRRDGRRRLVLAYLSIGEAESYRAYWQRDWQRQLPEWLLGENPEWPGNHAVQFWHPGWKALLCGTPAAALDRILAAGFDGIYLDKCDVTDDLRRHEPQAAAARADIEGDMVDLVRKLAAYARERAPGFLIVMQNAEPLLERAFLREAIDAVAREELFYGLDGCEVPNGREDVTWARERLDLMKKDGKPVLVVEYLDDEAKAGKAAHAASSLGYVLCVSPADRALDRLPAPVLA